MSTKREHKREHKTVISLVTKSSLLYLKDVLGLVEERRHEAEAVGDLPQFIHHF